jgi:cysteine synthase A
MSSLKDTKGEVMSEAGGTRAAKRTNCAMVDAGVRDRSAMRLGEAGVLLPTFRQLETPSTIPSALRTRLAAIDPDSADPLNLFRVHWFNDAARSGVNETPAHIELPRELTGVRARIVLALGNRFPMIRAHKVLTAYACLAPRLVSGEFDPSWRRAVWPSTGNYCRGGVAISRILGCRGVAVLPETMSQERFDWLDKWVADPADVVRVSGVEKILDACAALARDPQNLILNQFSEFANYLVHRVCTGAAMERLFDRLAKERPNSRFAAFVAATGSSGALAAGDRLKASRGALIVAAEPAECPTLISNGFGRHRIQGVGDGHIPLIHNVMNTDAAVGVSDRDVSGLFALFNTEAGRNYLIERRGVEAALVGRLANLGLSSICNLLAAIKTAKYFDFDEDDLVLSLATDGGELYHSEIVKTVQRDFGGRFDTIAAGETFGRALDGGASTEHVLELKEIDRRRAFNLGYFTWVESRGVPVEDFSARSRQAFWNGLLDLVPAWDSQIEEFNSKSGASARLAA